ncbi:MAG: hypothetical protein QOI66_4158 [Myxococcales bacterium]|nr:hypothetical protein [Myxococcales bacterium]
MSPAWDFLLLGPGVTLLVSAAFLILMATAHDASAALLATSLSILVVGPHYAATYRRAYTSRAIIRAHPLVTIVAPLILAAAALAALRFPTTVAPVYFLIYVVWSGYHYSGQSLGLAMIYPLRQGARLAADEKRLLAAPLHVSWLLSLLGLLRASGSVRNPAYQIVRGTFFGFSLPAWGLAAGVAALAASFSAVAILAVRRRRRNLPLPWPTYAVVATQILWFGWALFNPFFNIMLVPVFHGLQYLALTSWHNAKERRTLTAATGPRAFAVYALTVLLLGIVINPGLFALAGGLLGDAAIISATVITFVNLHHFLLDGRIWRMRESKVVQSFVETPSEAPPAL